MAYSQRPVAASMSHPDRWLAFLRIVVGLYFAKAFITKLSARDGGRRAPAAGRLRAVDQHDAQDREQAGGGQSDPVLQALPREHRPDAPETFAHLTALGETITGIGLTLGLLTGVASLVGLVLVTNYGLATQWMSPGQQGFHIVLFALMIAFFAARAGRTWGSTRCCGARGPSRSSRGVRSPERRT